MFYELLTAIRNFWLKYFLNENLKFKFVNTCRVAHLVAHKLVTPKVISSNPGKGD